MVPLMRISIGQLLLLLYICVMWLSVWHVLLLEGLFLSPFFVFEQPPATLYLLSGLYNVV